MNLTNIHFVIVYTYMLFIFFVLWILHVYVYNKLNYTNSII